MLTSQLTNSQTIVVNKQELWNVFMNFDSLKVEHSTLSANYKIRGFQMVEVKKQVSFLEQQRNNYQNVMVPNLERMVEIREEELKLTIKKYRKRNRTYFLVGSAVGIVTGAVVLSK